jgi:hypothetical protein
MSGANDLGGLSDVRVANGSVTQGQTVKATSGGWSALATTDPTSACSGIALDTVSNGANFRVARIGQPVVVLNDGAHAIAVGDPIVASAATSGEVTHTTASVGSGTGILGRALTTAVASAGTAFQIQFIPTTL